MSKQLAGIRGVLGTYVTAAESPGSEAEQPSPKPRREPATSTGATPVPSRRSKRPARLGRPPGKANDQMRPKEKTTLRIDAELMAEYRDWSWDQRCQLGELVERALADYRGRNR